MANIDWGNVPFINYLNEVDRVLEDEMNSDTSNQNDMDTVGACQEAGLTPTECAEEILNDEV